MKQFGTTESVNGVLIQGLSQSFKISRAELTTDVKQWQRENQSNLVHSPKLAESGFNYLLGGCHITNLDFSIFFTPGKVITHRLWQETQDYLGQVDATAFRLMFVVHVGAVSMGGCVSYAMLWDMVPDTVPAIVYPEECISQLPDFPQVLVPFKQVLKEIGGNMF